MLVALLLIDGCGDGQDGERELITLDCFADSPQVEPAPEEIEACARVELPPSAQVVESECAGTASSASSSAAAS